MVINGWQKGRNLPIQKKEFSYLKRILNKKQNILDVGCGYGRFSILLAKAGFNIQGIDITPVLIKKAKEVALKERVKVNFKIGDMRKLPYKNESFDAIICMWSVFVELLTKKDQLRAIKEMFRVLKNEGFAILEMPKPIKKSMEIGEDRLILKKNNIVEWFIDGRKARPSYNHSKKTLTDLMKKIKIRKYKIFIDNFGSRNRLFLQFWKRLG